MPSRSSLTYETKADTIVVLPAPASAILEKPRNQADQLGMLTDMNGTDVEVVTAVTLGKLQAACPFTEQN